MISSSNNKEKYAGITALMHLIVGLQGVHFSSTGCTMQKEIGLHLLESWNSLSSSLAGAGNIDSSAAVATAEQ